MTKTEIKKLANDCGYTYSYSGKEKKGFFEQMEGVQNVQIDPEKLKQLSKLMK